MKSKLKILLTLSLAGSVALSVGIPASLQVSAAEAQPFEPNVYVSEYDTKNDLSTAKETLEDELVAEGVTLMKNEEGALPLPSGAKISIFGKNSTRYGYAGQFTAEGFKVNPTLVSFYNDPAKSGSGRGTAPAMGSVTAGYNTGETPQENYTQDIKNSFASYNDAAIVVIYRAAGEGWDNPRTMMWDGETYGASTGSSTQLVPGARATDDHYLQLDENEAALIKMCGENFEKVIIFLNTPSTFETGFLDDAGHYGYHENIKAALFVGYPNQITSIPKILKGTINPSGRLVDTWARDFKLDPTWQNFGNYLTEGDLETLDDTKGNRYVNLPATGVGYANNFVTYNEGIYVGYRYYETRGLTEGKSSYTSASEQDKAAYLDAQSGGSAGKSVDYIHGTTTVTWKDWYSAHVVYPFGYGLSYTSFEQSIVSSEPMGNSVLSKDGTITLRVKVKNTGTVAGKDVVQVYYTAPYKAGEIEKAHVVLAAFEKTKLLAPQEEETLTLSFKVRDMASYDDRDANGNGFKGYELDAGSYTVKLMKNAHEEIASVNYTLSEGVKYETDEATGHKIENRFDDVTNYITDDLHQKYLSRNDWTGTWPKFNKRLTASQNVINGLHEWWFEGGKQTRDPSADEGMPYYTDQMPATGAKNGILLKDLHGLEYDDELWDDYLDQFTVDQFTEMVTRGYYLSGKNYPELGVKEMHNYDGPSYYGGYSYSTTVLRASTWNKELAYRFGKLTGEAGLWGFENQLGAWYSPAVNIHRSPFAGRNWEYYSEDGYLAGALAACEVKGAQEKGLPVYVKHFAVNNQETNRDGVMTWVNEQTMRELYFVPYEMCVKESDALGIMAAKNRLGTTWAGGSYALMTEILRNEWGFAGCVVTDSFPNEVSNIGFVDQMIRAGCDLALGYPTMRYNLGTPTTVACLREAAHSILYAQAHSNALNSIPQGEHYPVQTFSGGNLERGIVGIPYTQNIANARLSDVLYPDVDDSEIAYTVNADSRLPKGLTLSEDGVISGTPEEECNNFQFKIDAGYAGYKRTATFTVSIVGANGAIVYEAEEDLGTIPVGEAAELSVAGAAVYKSELEPGEVLPACTYALANGSALPEGLTLHADGKITGTPSMVAKNYSFTVVASAKGFASVSLTFRVNIYRGMTFEGTSLQNGKLGVSYLEKLPAAETEGEVTYALKADSKLPGGLTLTEGGYIVGIPRETVTDYTFTVVASSPYTQPVEAEFTISVGLSFNRITLQNGKAGEAYTARVDTAQGAGEVKYSLKAGSVLPEGLTLSESGVISGTPSAPGVYTLTVVASADGKLGDEVTLTLYIAGTLSSGGGPSGGPSGGTEQPAGGLSGGAVAGICVGEGVVLLAAGIVCGYFLAKKRLSRKESADGKEEQT